LVEEGSPQRGLDGVVGRKIAPFRKLHSGPTPISLTSPCGKMKMREEMRNGYRSLDLT
jgi:hypothetical protein